MTAPALELKGLTKRFSETTGVFDLDLTVAAGQIFGFLGPNGAGKTTTIRMVLDYLRPERGTARALGLDCRQDAVSLRDRIGYLPAEFNLYESMTGEGLLRDLAQYRPQGTLMRGHALAERLKIPLGGRIRTYSKGMKQKVALIQALMHDPELMILDEPSDGFDPLIQQEFHQILREARARGRTVFLSSHILSEVEAVCDRAAIIRQGRLLTVERVEALQARKVRTLTLQFAEAVDAARLVLPRAVLKEQASDRAVFAVTGADRELMAAIAQLPVSDVTLEPARLEEVFLSFYEGATP